MPNSITGGDLMVWVGLERYLEHRQRGEIRTRLREKQAIEISSGEVNHRIPEGRNGLAVVRTMTQWTLDYKADSIGLDFPLDRPYLGFYNRCSIGLRAIETFLRSPFDDHRKVVGVMKRLHRILGQYHHFRPLFKMKTSLTLRLPEELRMKIRKEARYSDMSINQYVLYTLTKEISYKEAERGLKEHIRKAVSHEAALRLLDAIVPDVPALRQDELPSTIFSRLFYLSS